MLTRDGNATCIDVNEGHHCQCMLTFKGNEVEQSSDHHWDEHQAIPLLNSVKAEPHTLELVSSCLDLY